MEKQEDLDILFHKLMNNQSTPEEIDRLMALLSSDAEIKTFSRLINKELKIPVSFDELDHKTKDGLRVSLQNILASEMPLMRPKGNPLWIRLNKHREYFAAASVALLVAAAACFLLIKPAKKITGLTSRENIKNDVAPGGNKAVLTLANGTTIVLDRAHNGQVANQGNIKVVKVNSGLLAYSPQSAAGSGQPAVNGKEAVVQFNRLSTPRGGQYQLVLPDGSKAWLNAASSIRYPTAFAGKERKVEITGEVYFEVAHDPDKPFRVAVGDMEVEVLGTHFNINAYEDEATIKTTLLEGGVKVTEGSHVQMLKPGEQAGLNRDGQISLVKDANVDAAVAWKDGYFSFDKADLQTVMHQLSRWYNVDVVYQGDIPPQEFGGEIQRNLNLSQVLLVLKQSQIHFKIEGNNLIVLP